jgi:serine/threonine-protein kinase RsbW
MGPSPLTLKTKAMDLTSNNLNHFPQELALPSETAEVQRLQGQILEDLASGGFSERECFGIKLALEEALVNAVKHGNRFDRNKKVYVAYRIADDLFTIRIRDEGPGFDPNDVPDPTLEENLERPCGRGLLLMRHYMNEVQYLGKGNEVLMWKRKSPPGKK